jgi:glycosyltransferase involved in cell wall biosynthesis
MAQLAFDIEDEVDFRLSGKTILYVVNDPDFFISHRLNIGLEALKQGLKVIVASPTGVGASKLKNYGFEHFEIPLSRWGGNPLVEIKTTIKLIKLYNFIKPDLVHHVTIKPVLYGSIAARIVGIPVVNAISGMGHVFVTNGFFALIRKFFVLLLYRLAFANKNLRVIFQNEDDRNEFLQHHLIKKDRTVIVRGSGVDPFEYTPQLSNEVPSIQGKEKLILFSGRLLQTKGIYDFINAAKILKNKGVKARFVLAGDTVPNNPASVSKQLVESWVKEGLVEAWGYCNDMIAVLNQADIVCLPSYREGLPRALIEAASCGKALVATNVPGCREIVVDNRNGYLVPIKNPELLAKALLKLIENEDLISRFGQESRRMVLEDGFSSQTVVKSTMELYYELL